MRIHVCTPRATAASCGGNGNGRGKSGGNAAAMRVGCARALRLRPHRDRLWPRGGERGGEGGLLWQAGRADRETAAPGRRGGAYRDAPVEDASRDIAVPLRPKPAAALRGPRDARPDDRGSTAA